MSVQSGASAADVRPDTVQYKDERTIYGSMADIRGSYDESTGRYCKVAGTICQAAVTFARDVISLTPVRLPPGRVQPP